MTSDTTLKDRALKNRALKDRTPKDHMATPAGSSPDEFSVFMPQRARRAGWSARQILLAGVAGACVLGVGLGLWARPAMSERQMSVAPPAEPAPKAPAAARRLAIVVDDRPAPVGAPIEVLPREEPPRPMLAPPVLAPQELIQVRAVAPASPQPPASPKPPVAPKLAAMVVAALAPHRVETPTPPKAPPIHLAKAAPPARPAFKAAPQAAPKAAPKIDLARAAAARAAARRLELAQAERTAKARKLEQLQLAKAGRQRQFELARAEAKGRAEARAEARQLALAEARDDQRKRLRLASLVRTVQRILPHEATRTRAAPRQVAKLDRGHAAKVARHEPVHHEPPHHEPAVERASLKTRKAPPHPAPVYRTHAPPPPLPHASGLMRVSTPRCASRDPGEALVCADPSLGAADRQLARAYRSARAAGVPDATLRQQQQRWLTARSSAAREAPWAVHDVYLARIAELNGQAREIRGDGY